MRGGKWLCSISITERMGRMYFIQLYKKLHENNHGLVLEVDHVVEPRDGLTVDGGGGEEGLLRDTAGVGKVAGAADDGGELECVGGDVHAKQAEGAVVLAVGVGEGLHKEEGEEVLADVAIPALHTAEVGGVKGGASGERVVEGVDDAE